MSLLSPSAIAVIGASAQEGKVGHDIFKNLLTQGFSGKVFPVNPKGGEILGEKAYATVSEIPVDIDLAVIVTPAATVKGLLQECAQKKIGSVIVITAGFSETGKSENIKEEAAIASLAKEHGIRLVGVNCLGLIRPSLKLNASFAKDMPNVGDIALISQSGALAVALMDEARSLKMGFSFVASVGNKTVMDECDFLRLCADDEETDVIGLYLESIKNGTRFRALAEEVAKTKPIVLLKSGTSSRGMKAISSHTGALAGSDAAIDALCKQTGIRRAKSAEEFTDALRMLSSQPPLLSRRIAIVTNAGGPGILATDATEKEGLELASLSKAQEDKLKTQLPPAASVKNPIDVLGDAGADRFAAAFDACGLDQNIDGIVLLLTPQVMTPCLEIAEVAVAAMRKFPLMPMAACFMGGPAVSDAKAFLESEGIPSFATPEQAVRAISRMRFEEIQEGKEGPKLRTVTRAKKAQSILKNVTGLLPDKELHMLCELYKFPIPSQAVAESAAEAVEIAQRIGMPVVAKIQSPDIVHKTDIGAVRANLKTSENIAKAYTDIMAASKKHMPKAKLDGVLIQKFLPVGNEFIVGAVRDASFGPLIMAGLGGIYTELFRDTSFRLAPLKEEDAYRMLEELKAWKLLLGMRGKEQSDIDALANLVLTVSQLMTECPQIKELDFNPVLVNGTGVTIADAKIVIV